MASAIEDGIELKRNTQRTKKVLHVSHHQCANMECIYVNVWPFVGIFVCQLHGVKPHVDDSVLVVNKPRFMVLYITIAQNIVLGG